jgi:hypothetical protein
MALSWLKYPCYHDIRTKMPFYQVPGCVVDLLHRLYLLQEIGVAIRRTGARTAPGLDCGSSHRLRTGAIGTVIAMWFRNSRTGVLISVYQ